MSNNIKNNLVKAANYLNLLEYPLGEYYNTYPNNITNVIQKTANNYNLTDLEELILALNYYDIVGNYGKEVPTDNKDLVTREDSEGHLFTNIISKEIIEKIKKMTNPNTQLTTKFFYATARNHLFKKDITELEKKYPNISLDKIKMLFDMTKNEEYYDLYLTLLNKCDERTQELILEYIKPVSNVLSTNLEKYIGNYQLGSNNCNHNNHFLFQQEIKLLSYLDDKKEKNEYQKNEKFQLIKNELPNWDINIYYIKEIEHLYLDQFELIQKVITFPNNNDLLKHLITFKKMWLKTIPNYKNNIVITPIYTTENIVYDDLPFEHNFNILTHSYEKKNYDHDEKNGEIDFKEGRIEEWLVCYKQITNLLVKREYEKILERIVSYDHPELFDFLYGKKEDNIEEKGISRTKHI